MEPPFFVVILLCYSECSESASAAESARQAKPKLPPPEARRRWTKVLSCRQERWLPLAGRFGFACLADSAVLGITNRGGERFRYPTSHILLPAPLDSLGEAVLKAIWLILF